MKKIVILSIFIIFGITKASTQQTFTAYIFMAEECPVCNYLGKTLKRISTDYGDKVNFVAVFPQQMSNIKTASLFKKKYDLPLFTVQIDHKQIITNRYLASITPEVVLVDEKDQILYQGRINNSYAAPGRMRHGKVTEDLELAIKQVLAGDLVKKPWPDPIGCYITKI